MGDTSTDAGASPAPSAPARGRAPSRRRRQLWPAFAAAPLALVLAIVGWYGFVAFSADRELKRDDDLLIGYDAKPPRGIGENFLVLSRSAPNRSKVAILMHLDRLGGRLFMVSLPGNLEVRADGRSLPLHDVSRQGEIVKAVEELFGARIEHVASVDIEGFVGLTDALGGIVVDNPHPSTTREGTRFERGAVRLDGATALAFIDDESPMPDRDSVIAARQRSVLRALVLRVLTPQILANPVEFRAVLHRLTGFVTVDSAATSGELWRLATSSRLDSSSDLVSLRPPVAGTARTASGEEMSVLDRPMAAELGEALRQDALEEYDWRHPS